MVKAPFPWFGGKGRIAERVWDRVGRVDNYVEPFAGSCAMLLSNPTPAAVETVNDADAFLANFWRAVKAAPLEVAAHADYPVSEIDLVARHRALVRLAGGLERLKEDPDAFDAKLAGWWVWGQCAWIGSGWCRGGGEQLPHLGDPGMGVNRKLPHLGNPGMGVNRKLPHLGNPGMGEQRLAYVEGQMTALASRLRDVRIACGDWRRVLGDSTTFRHGRTMIFLDPPYDDAEHCVDYNGGGAVWADVCAWAIEAGKREDMAVVLCGYDGTFTPPERWDALAWKAAGGYGSQGKNRGRDNCKREVVWFSPGCGRPGLFEATP